MIKGFYKRKGKRVTTFEVSDHLTFFYQTHVRLEEWRTQGTLEYAFAESTDRGPMYTFGSEEEIEHGRTIAALRDE